MRAGLLPTSAFALIVLAAGCAPGIILPERDIDPSPLLQALRERNAGLQAGVSGTLEMDYKGKDGRFRGKAFVIVFPDGRFRIEIPGLMGSTILIMVSDGEEVLAYYPEEGEAFRGPARGRSLGEFLPFSLPLEAAAVPSLLLGTVIHRDSGPGETRSSLLGSGERTLQIPGNGNGPDFYLLFSPEDPPSLRAVRASLGDMRLKVATVGKPPFLPDTFTLTLGQARFTGRWEEARPFLGDTSALELKIPRSVPVFELEDLP